MPASSTSLQDISEWSEKKTRGAYLGEDSLFIVCVPVLNVDSICIGVFSILSTIVASTFGVVRVVIDATVIVLANNLTLLVTPVVVNCFFW